MTRRAIHKCQALLFLVLLLAARGGQIAHIYGEDPLHFAAFAGDLVPDNGAAERVADLCIVDDFQLFSFFEEPLPAPSFRAVLLGMLPSAPTCCKRCPDERAQQLRAPPAV
ncbi:hypothetical protein [Alistipes sp.]|uniref:hypothetical protein n=1 Tax=Alistipes sp. TaxID=1872444 RepID=UPI0025B9E116|nr:hypothetical protein [Alistipes sp.]